MAASSKSIIDQLRSMRPHFSPYIERIVFPRYRSFLPGSRIEFDFPITAFVGENGSGKTSALHALYGAPENQSVERYWFSTAVDDIDGLTQPPNAPSDKSKQPSRRQSLSDRHCFWYEYFDTSVNPKKLRQAAKSRILRAGKSDYWEPTRPIKQWGMTLLDGAGRHPQIKMKAEFISLRFQLNAFDKCFHFHSNQTLIKCQGRQWARRLGRKTPLIQDYLRHRSVFLQRVFETEQERRFGKSNDRAAESPISISSETTEKVSKILGKDYVSATRVVHRLFEGVGTTVRFQDRARHYTDATAGSGESIVFEIVRVVEGLPNHSLILLDEPEISLHPGAQRRLVEYLLQRCKEKCLQIVLSTHSPTIVELLPSESIKVFRPIADGLVQIENGVAAEDAFVVLGHRFGPRVIIIVEDSLAADLLSMVLESLGQAFKEYFQVEFRPGGASQMMQDIESSIHEKISNKPIFMFDGDQDPKCVVDPDKLTHAQRGDLEFLESSIKRVTKNGRIKYHQDSNMSDESKCALRIKYLEYWRDRVRFLPFRHPDEAIWSDEVCKNYLRTICHEEKFEEIIALRDYKRRYQILDSVSTHNTTAVHRIFLTAFSRGSSEPWVNLQKMLRQIRIDSNASSD